VIPDYTLVIGVDQSHLQQLTWTWPTWRKHKPSILKHPMIVFRDWQQVTEEQVKAVVDHPNLRVYSWPPVKMEYERVGEDRFGDPQRHKMLSGFIYVAAAFVRTPYWLKLDTDVVATGRDDWIDPNWFTDEPAIVSHPWAFTRPPDQMLKLDAWVEANKNKMPVLSSLPPLDMRPIPGKDRLDHKRIISWCAFFNTRFTTICRDVARSACGNLKLPIPSQDGFCWYVAARMGLGVQRHQMKKRGWQHWHTSWNIRTHAEEAMKDGKLFVS